MTLRARLERLENRAPAPDTAPHPALVEMLDTMAARKASGDAGVQSEIDTLVATLEGNG